MDIFSYVGNVKTIKEGEILSAILNVEVSATDLDSGLESIINNQINLDTLAEQWIISKAVKKALDAQGYREATLVDSARYGLATIKALAPEVSKLVKGYNDKLWDGKLMTVKQANLLNLVEYMGFWVRYTRMMFDTLLTMNNESTEPAKYLQPVDLKWLNGTELFYRQFTLDLFKGGRSILTNLEKLPDVEISQGSLNVLETTEGKGHIDMLNKGFGVHLVNPIFWLGLGFSKLQSMWIEKLRRDNEYFAMKISQAINKRNQSNDPELDRRIEIYQDKIIRNDHSISEIEAQYA